MVIIVCGSRQALIEQCLASLAAQPEARALQLVLVNNVLLTKQECESIERRHAQSFASLEFIHNVQPLGFATNNNRAAQRALPRIGYFLFLNDDTIVPFGALGELIKACSTDATIGAITPRLVYPDGRTQRCTSYFPLGWDGVLLALTGRKRNVDPRAGRRFWLRGVCLLVRRSAFESVGGWDSSYDPGYGEDIELCYQLWERGWRLAVCDRASVVHYESQSFHKYSDAWYRLSFCGMWQFIRRHTSPIERTVLVVSWVIGLLLRLAASLFPLIHRVRGRPLTYAKMLSCLVRPRWGLQ